MTPDPLPVNPRPPDSLPDDSLPDDSQPDDGHPAKEGPATQGHTPTRTRQARWRLVMGPGSEQLCGELSAEDEERDACLGFLYDREYGGGRNVRMQDGERKGSLDESRLTVPDWINQIHELFPKGTIERLEKDALERYQLDEMVTNPEVLARAKPNQTLLKAVLRTKHLMNQELLKAAQHLVRQVVEQLMSRRMYPLTRQSQWT